MRHLIILIIFKMIDHSSDEQRTIVEADDEVLAIREFYKEIAGESYQILNVMELSW